MIRKRSVLIAGHATSVSIEAPFWDALKDIATRRGLSLNDLIAEIDAGRDGNLSSAIRVFVLETVRGGLDVRGSLPT
ncbi:MAG: ribbon-helix-helix domain-containing protein [Alphaproteobacteria bacterium]|nr:ribbon-helix-helix domain-containing protein [Alphaproteobacteria bacterium]